MAFLIANKDGTSNAQPGDTVITGGGLYVKQADGSSKFLSPLPTATGKTGSYEVLQGIYKSLNVNIGTKGGSLGALTKDGKLIPGTGFKYDQNEVIDTSWNYDSFTSPEYNPSDYAAASGSGVSGSSIAGYIIVGLVGLAVLDRFVGGSPKGR